jgi:hypothetical protein
VLAQVADYVLGAGLVPDIDAPVGAPPTALGGGRFGHKRVQGGHVRQDAVLAYISLLRPTRVGFRGGETAWLGLRIVVIIPS